MLNGIPGFHDGSADRGLPCYARNDVVLFLQLLKLINNMPLLLPFTQSTAHSINYFLISAPTSFPKL